MLYVRFLSFSTEELTVHFSGCKLSIEQFILKCQAFDRDSFPHHPQGNTDMTQVTYGYLQFSVLFLCHPEDDWGNYPHLKPGI